jgi:Protein of unknown function (DUF3987)
VKIEGPEWLDIDTSILGDSVPPAPELENDALPSGWAEWIREEAVSRGCPVDYVAASVLAGASAWIGNARRAEVSATRRAQPHLWLALIGPPSSRKTPGQLAVMSACSTLESYARPEWDRAMADHALAVEIAKVADDGWKAAVREARKTGGNAPDRPADAVAPDAPPCSRVSVNDSTIEELQYLLSQHPRGLLCFRDELSGLLGNMDKYGGNGGDRAFHLESWNGNVYIVDRVKHRGKPLRIPMNSLGILGGIQLDRVKEVFSSPNDGLVARFGYVWPEPSPIVNLTRGSNAADEGRQSALIIAARRLHALKLKDPEPGGDPGPRHIRLSDNAFELLNRLHIETETTAQASTGIAGGWHGKSEERAIRLSVVYEYLAWAEKSGSEPEPTEVSSDAMMRACAYVDYLTAMFERVTAGCAIGKHASDARAVAQHIIDKTITTLHPSDLYLKPGWRWLRDTGRREGAIQVLVKAGWLRLGLGRMWEVNPAVHS